MFEYRVLPKGNESLEQLLNRKADEGYRYVGFIQSYGFVFERVRTFNEETEKAVKKTPSRRRKKDQS